MDSLPLDIINLILPILERSDLVSLMLIARRYYLHVRGVLYSHLRINMFGSNNRVLSAIWRQDYSVLPTPLWIVPARLVRHLTVIGAAMASAVQRGMLCSALAQMAGLLSLEMAIRTFPDSTARDVFDDSSCRSPTFLPELLALKTDDARVAMGLVPGRPVYAVFVEDTVPSELRQHFLLALATSNADISQLQVRLEVGNNDEAVATFQTIANQFGMSSTLCIELFIVEPSEKPLSWISIKVSTISTSRFTILRSSPCRI